MKNVLNKFLRRKSETIIDDHLTELENNPDDVSINPFTGQPVATNAEPESLDLEPIDLSGEPYNKTEESVSKKKQSGLKLPKLNNVFSIGPDYALIVFHAGSFGLRGALIRNTRHYSIPAVVAESRNVDFTRAIAEVLEQLKQYQKRLPQRAILITPSVVSSLVNLPVSPLRPRPADEMQELIRWELEGAVTQQNKQWLIGSMLVERGYLSNEQRDELVSELQLRQSQGGEGAMIRFGDLAVQLKYISYAQLEECFALQGKLVALDDELIYGWQAEESLSEKTLSDEALLSTEEDNNSSHKWLVSGMSKEVRRRWVGAFKLNGLTLEAFYPSIGASFANLSQRTTSAEQWLIEMHQEQLAFISGHAGSVTDIQVAERLPGDLSAQQIISLTGVLPADLQTLYLNHQGQLSDDELLQIKLELGVNVESLTQDFPDLVKPEALNKDALLSLAGAADHFLQHIARPRLSWITARDAEPPVWQKMLQPQTLKLTAATLVIIGMAGFMGWMHLNMWQQEARLAELNAKFEKESELKKQYGSILSEQSSLKEQIATARHEVDLNATVLVELNSELPQQQLTVPVLLKAISISIPPGVKLASVKRLGETVSIQAEAGSDAQGQAFTHNLNQLLKPVNLQVSSSDVIFEEENDSLLPYMIDIVLQEVPTSATDVTNQSNLIAEGP